MQLDAYPEAARRTAIYDRRHKVIYPALGLASATAVTRMLRGLLYGVTPLDGATIAGVIVLLGAVALMAIAGPAWRASRVDPTTALRAE